MSARPALLVNAAELLRAPGTRKHVAEVVPAEEIDAMSPAITGELVIELDLESTVDDIGLTGTISVPWTGHCRRCLKPLTQILVVDVDERYAPPTTEGGVAADDPADVDGAFPIHRGQIDLRQVVREEVLLAVDDVPLCRPDCPGLCPLCGKDVSVEPCDCDATLVDDRWAVLDQLRDD